MHKIILICLVSLTLLVNAAGQQRNGYQSAEELQRDVTFLLLDKNIGDVIKQLDREDSSTADSLLRRLVIYSRAGQSSRVRKTLEQLPSASDWQCPAGDDLRSLIRNAAGDNLASQRLYYERICPDDIEGSEQLVRLWASNGDLKELDTWLAERSIRHKEFLMLRVQTRAKSGTAGEVLDGLAAEVRAHPSDWERVNLYLEANNRAGSVQDVKWLAETFEARTAGDYFQLADILRRHSAETSVTLLQKSLEIPFTDADAKFVSDQINRYRSVGLSIKINWEKQLRYWTKRRLAETYQDLNQSLAAQPLVEELLAMKVDDILTHDIHKFAGVVQSESGQRVVETKILRDEVARRSTSAYWLERARYYNGREEYRLERDTYRQALIALAANPNDSNALYERFEVVRLFAFFLGQEYNGKEDKPELEKLLTVELNSVPPETDYAFQVAVVIIQNELELDALQNSLLAKRPSFLARMLDARREWTKAEKYLISDIVDHYDVPEDLRDKIWSSLAPLVRDPGSTRAFFLADAMQDDDEWQRAVPLWRGYIEHAHPDNWEGYKREAISNLFTAYCKTKQWRAAEKFLMAQRDSLWRDLPKALAEVAVVAAQQNAIDDAMRLWLMSTNLDRLNLEALKELSRTSAKPQLLAMYTKMKTDDPQSTIPDLALSILR